MGINKNLSVGLISMPWMSPNIPSIQLATLRNALDAEGIASQPFEFFLDYAATIGLNLYNKLGGAGQFIDEYLFATHYYRAEKGNNLSEFLQHRPRLGYDSEEFEEQLLRALDLVTGDFLIRLAEDTDWSKFNAVGFSLTISQTASSMALARLIKLKFPKIPIIFGGTSCAGPMGPALMRICPYIDIVVGVEGELILPELIRRLASKREITSLKGISWRVNNEVITNSDSQLIHNYLDRQQPLEFDAYFERKERLNLSDKIETWLPFESSRGCWYGEKNQCKFCGLHEIMKYRGRDSNSVISELEHWSEKYGINRFFSVDLIMPMSYYDTFLAEIKRRNYQWNLFYEIKANVKRSHVEKLAGGGVKWVQPGLESLDSEILKLMNKGVTTVQNIQLLKWCEEFGIRVTWNIITGIPMEDPASYSKMTVLIRKLHHLFPPSGVSHFALHRFSPYFEHPEDYGLKSVGAHPLYKYIFPVNQQDLDDLVYHHKYELDRPKPLKEYTEPVVDAINEWKKAFQRKAKLAIGDASDGYASILDTRWSEKPTIYSLNESELTLYKFLDEGKLENSLRENFICTHPESAKEIEQNGGIENLLSMWDRDGLIVNVDHKLLALAISYTKEGIANRNVLEKVAAPVSYLDF